ncbi:MAG: hypothetical protein ACE5HQ_06230 [Gemmatimonadota bacterium]
MSQPDQEPSPSRESAFESKVRKVLHLDPFRFSAREDGRFTAELCTAPENLSPEEARALLDSLEPMLERIRARASD